MVVNKRILAVGTAAVLLLTTMLATVSTQSAFTASVADPSNALGSGTSFYTAKDSGGNTVCSSAPSGSSVLATSAFTCSGTPFPATTSTTQATTSLTQTNSGTAAFSSATLKAASCYPAMLENTASSTYPLLVRGDVAYQTAGPDPLSGSSSLRFNGVNTMGTGIKSATGLQTYTLGIWFKTSVKGGVLAGWTSSSSPLSPGNYDRTIYLSTDGYLTFATYVNGAQIAQGTTNVADNNWHYAAVTASAGATTSTLNLYLDNALVGTKSINSTSSSEGVAGYWRVGNSVVNNATYGNSTNYFDGYLSDFSVFPSVLAATDMTSLYNAGTQSTYVTRATNLGASSLWTLGDTGLVPYMTTLTAGSPCGRVNVTFNSVGGTLAQVNNVSLAINPATPTSAQVITFTSKLNASNAFDPGLHLLIPITITENGFTQTFTWPRSETIIG